MKNFWDAREHCRNEGAYLAYPTSDAESDFIAGLLPGWCFWIGVNDIDEEGKWVTDDGRMISYSNWRHDQPNNAPDHDGVKICHGEGLWYDDSTNSLDQYLCYFRIESKSQIPDDVTRSTLIVGNKTGIRIKI